MKKSNSIINVTSVFFICFGFLGACSFEASSELSLTKTMFIYSLFILFVVIGVLGVKFSDNPSLYLYTIESISFAFVKSVYTIFSHHKEAIYLKRHFNLVDRFILFYNESIDEYERKNG